MGGGTPAAPGSGSILSLNGGSSSLKFALFDLAGQRLAEGSVERIGAADGRAWVVRGERREERPAACADQRAALAQALELLGEASVRGVRAVGHRVVHGGAEHTRPALVDDALLASLQRLASLAPLHLPASIAGIEAMRERRPELPQVACFDTAFHATLPEVARRLPLPERFAEVRRYGFHGLSYESIVTTLGAALPPRLVIAHLGNGASLVAVERGRAIDTTMSFTPGGGIVMGTRTGDLDPGVLVYLARAHGLDPDALERLVERESGLLALGGSSDMQVLLERAPVDARARLALEVFGYGVRKAIGAYMAALGGLDLLVFSGGIGEHAAPIRAAACRGLDALGVTLDAGRNARGESVISGDSSRTVVRVVRTHEDEVIARHTRIVTSLAPD